MEAIRDRWGSAEAIIERWPEPVAHSNRLPLAVVMSRVAELPLFGPWAQFKAADLCERVLAKPIDFPSDLALIYREPRAALDLFEGNPETAAETLTEFFSKWPAPPRYERPCHVAETETCLCKFKSFQRARQCWQGHSRSAARSSRLGTDRRSACIAPVPLKWRDGKKRPRTGGLEGP